VPQPRKNPKSQNRKFQRKTKQTTNGRTKDKYQAIPNLEAVFARLVFLCDLML
jgi:hypothetical protein